MFRDGVDEPVVGFLQRRVRLGGDDGDEELPEHGALRLELRLRLVPEPSLGLGLGLLAVRGFFTLLGLVLVRVRVLIVLLLVILALVVLALAGRVRLVVGFVDLLNLGEPAGDDTL